MAATPIFFANPAYLMLGPIPLFLITYLEGFRADYTYGYVEHRIIEQKSHLQWVGDELETRQLFVRLHSMYCIPDLEFWKLKAAADLHYAYLLFFSCGRIEGWFVIKDMNRILVQTDALGNVIYMDLAITLLEYFWEDDPASSGSGLSSYIPAINLASAVVGGGMLATTLNPQALPGIAAGAVGVAAVIAMGALQSALTALDSLTSAAQTLDSTATTADVSAVANGVSLPAAASVAGVAATSASGADFIASDIGGPIAKGPEIITAPAAAADAIAASSRRQIGLSPYISASPGASTGSAAAAAQQQTGGGNTLATSFPNGNLTPNSTGDGSQAWAVNMAAGAMPAAARQT